MKSRISTLIWILSAVSKWHGTKWKRAKIYNLAEGSFIFSCRESHSGMLSTVATQGVFSPSSRLLEDEISAPVSPCCHSRVQIFRLVRRISIYPIYDTCVSVVRRRDDGDDSPRWTQFGRYSVSLSFPLNLFIRSPTRVRSINVYNAARSPSLFMPLESLYDWKKLTDYKLIKADQEGTEFSTDNGGDFFDLLHWFRRTRVELSGSWTRGSPYIFLIIYIISWLGSWSSNFF